MERKFKGTPPRLPVIFQKHSAPLYFVTFNTLLKRPILANDTVQIAFVNYARKGESFMIATGRYVIMPDHIHVFIRPGPEIKLARWESGLKRVLGRALATLGYQPNSVPDGQLTSFWQPGFFDHLLRQDESYARKWDYVWHNPVRANLVAKPADWPYQGEVHVIDRA